MKKRNRQNRAAAKATLAKPQHVQITITKKGPGEAPCIFWGPEGVRVIIATLEARDEVLFINKGVIVSPTEHPPGVRVNNQRDGIEIIYADQWQHQKITVYSRNEQSTIGALRQLER